MIRTDPIGCRLSEYESQGFGFQYLVFVVMIVDLTVLCLQVSHRLIDKILQLDGLAIKGWRN